MTFSVSLTATVRAELKFASENSMPAVPLLTLLEVKNAPATVAPLVMEKAATDALLLMTDGSPVVEDPKVHVARMVALPLTE